MTGAESEDATPFRHVDTANRRVAGVAYVVAAAVSGLVAYSANLDAMWIAAVTPLLVIAAYHFGAGRRMAVSDMEAIAAASEAAEFEVGHASCTIGFSGLMARPIWQVLVFEAGHAPGHQALVTVDAISGAITGTFQEAIEPVMGNP